MKAHPREHYEQVAEVYREAVATGSHTPVADVAETWKVPHSTAAGWVKRAKRLGEPLPATWGTCRGRCAVCCPK